MSDGDTVEDAAMEPTGVMGETAPSIVARPGERRDENASEQAAGDVVEGNGPSSRANDIRSLLNDDEEEVIASSDEGERDANGQERCVNGSAEQAEGISPTIVSDTALAIATVASASAETGATQLHGANTDQDRTVEDTEMKDADAVQVETIVSSGVGGKTEVEAPSAPVQAPMTQDVRTNGLPKRRTRASARTKTPDSEVANETALVVASEEAALVNDANGQTKKRDKRLPTPRSSQPSPLKKPKTKSTAKPKATLSQVVDVTMTDEDEELSGDIELVVASHAQKTGQQRGSKVSTAASVPVSKLKKRKSISDRQIEELMNDDRRPGGSTLTDLTTLGITHTVDLTPRLRQCEFCRLAHSGYTTLHCQACRRVYHDKCLVNEFRSLVQDGIPIEEQMATLTLHRPQGHGSVLRCVGCHAAFRELYKNRGVHWDCQCPTCKTDPLKIADYRRVMLKRIIDEHNDEFALKKQQKNAGGRKGASNGPGEAKPKSKPEAPKETAPPVNSRARTRRKAGIANQDDEEKKDTTMTVDNGMIVATELIVNDAVNVEETVNEDGDNQRVSKSSQDASLAESQQSEEVNEEYPDKAISTPVTLDMLADSVSLSKEDGVTWHIQIACSFPMQQGYYKEATYYLHPSGRSKIKCSCCDRVEDSLRWFVQHTDASALAALDEGSGDYQKCVVVPLKGAESVPLDVVVELLHQKLDTVQHSKATKPRNRRVGDHVAEELNLKEKIAISVLETVVFQEKPKEVKRKGNAAHVQYSCTVYSGPQRFIKPMSNGAMCRLTLLDCGVSADAYKCGTFDIVVNPQKGKVLCSCCDERMSPAQFRLHWADPPTATQKEEGKADGSPVNPCVSDDDTTDESEAHGNPKPIDSPPPSTERGVLCVAHRDPLLGLPFDKFLEALVALKGTQAQMNELVSSLSKSPEPMIQTIQL